MYYEEENNYPKAFLATGIIFAVMIALCYFIVFQGPAVLEDGIGGIVVNYGTTDAGMGNDITSMEQPSVSPKSNHSQPTKVNQAQPNEQKTKVDNSNEKIVTQNNEDAPEVAANSKKPSKAVATEPAKPVKKQVVNTNALYKGPSSKGSGAGDGTTKTPGNQGSRNGSTLSNNYGPGGSGGGLNMPNWSFVSTPDVSNPHRVPGRVVIDFTVDQNGNVIEAHWNKNKTKAELNQIQNCVDAIRNSKFTSSTPATGTQKGEMTFLFKVD
jgi:TonB family protein